MRAFALAFAVFALVAVAASYAARASLERALSTPRDPAGVPRLIDVPDGERTPALLRRLQREGLVASGWLMALYGASLREARPLVPGEYRLGPGLTPIQLLERVERGLRHEHTVALRPGMTVSEVAEVLAAERLVASEAFVRAAEDPELARRLGIRGPTVEGFLFPDVWALPRRLGAEALIRRLTGAFFEAVPSLGATADRLGLTPYQFVILASLVERGPVPAEERRLYAALLLERLQQGYALESAAADAYGRARRGAPADPREDPWNTTDRVGLPATPIGSPGLAALRATAEPADTEPLFMVRRGGGRHVFCPDVPCYLQALARHVPGQAPRFPLRER